jgi:hypothetical protein
MDALCNLIVGTSFLSKPFAFTFLGDEPLAPINKTFMSLSSPILEGIKILQKVSV